MSASYKIARVTWPGVTGGPYHHFEIGLYHKEGTSAEYDRIATATVAGNATYADLLPSYVPQSTRRYALQIKGFESETQDPPALIIIEEIVKYDPD